MLESAGAGAAPGSRPGPRAFLQVAGAPVAWHQLGMALAADCRKILCLAHELSPDIVALQHSAEAAGAQFAVVIHRRQLSSLVTAADELVVFSDGLLAIPQTIAPLLEGGPVVLVQPDEPAIAQGFERIDINHAFAGALRIPGRLVEALAELPADCDVVSALTRIALQGGVPQAMVPAGLREAPAWMLVRDEADAHAAEVGMVDLALRRDKATTPGAAIARLGVRAFAPALLHGGSGGNAVAAGAFVTLVMGLAAGWFALTALALVLLGAAWIARHAAELVMDVTRARRSRFPRVALFGWLIDAALVLLIAWAATPPSDARLADVILVPMLFVCLLRILAGAFERRWTGWLQDRAIVCLVLAVPAAAGLLREAVEALALVAGLAGAFLAALGARLTRT